MNFPLPPPFQFETFRNCNIFLNCKEKTYIDMGLGSEFTKTNKNIAVDKWHIATKLKHLLDDAMYWHKNNTYTADEIAIRFKHRIVSIHCFCDRNGRHSRLMADIIIEKVYKQPVFTCGAANFLSGPNARQAYLKAVKAVDHGDYDLLLSFARS